jgi:mono/diheme cytochrome c family protein
LRSVLKAVAGLLALAMVCFGLVAWSLVRRGFGARDEPSALETAVARTMRRLATPAAARRAGNPVAITPEGTKRARTHFADHCASCHGNDGRGRTTLGQNLYPRAPDMTQAPTQSLSDGELFSIIENGVRLTGMPAWGSPSPDDDVETWELVHFLRGLSKLTPEDVAELEAMNPKTRAQIDEEEAIRKFLAGED